MRTCRSAPRSGRRPATMAQLRPLLMVGGLPAPHAVLDLRHALRPLDVFAALTRLRLGFIDGYARLAPLHGEVFLVFFRLIAAAAQPTRCVEIACGGSCCGHGHVSIQAGIQADRFSMWLKCAWLPRRTSPRR